MASSGANGSTSSSGSSPAPKILLAKPGIASAGPSSGKFIRGSSSGGGGGAEDDSASIRSRLPPVGSLNLLSDSWEFHIDRFLPFLTDNTDFTVVGVVGPPGVGKSTIMNEIYGFDPISPGMLPPFALQTEENRANARHCTVGIEPRVTGERIILLDTQPILSPSILAEITRPDGSSTIPIFSGENLSAELAHEIMGIRLGVLLASVCHILLVVSEGVHDSRTWNLMSTVDLLKHGIPDPSSVTTSHSQSSNPGSEKENNDKLQEHGEEYMASPVFVHTKLRDEDLTPWNSELIKKVLGRYFNASSFLQDRYRSLSRQPLSFLKSCDSLPEDVESTPLSLFMLPLKSKDDSSIDLYGSYDVMLSDLRNQVLSMKRPAFSRPVSERDWLKNTAKIWELVKTSSTVAEYCKMLQNSGMVKSAAGAVDDQAGVEQAPTPIFDAMITCKTTTSSLPLAGQLETHQRDKKCDDTSQASREGKRSRFENTADPALICTTGRNSFAAPGPSVADMHKLGIPSDVCAKEKEWLTSLPAPFLQFEAMKYMEMARLSMLAIISYCNALETKCKGICEEKEARAKVATLTKQAEQSATERDKAIFNAVKLQKENTSLKKKIEDLQQAMSEKDGEIAELKTQRDASNVEAERQRDRAERVVTDYLMSEDSQIKVADEVGPCWEQGIRIGVRHAIAKFGEIDPRLTYFTPDYTYLFDEPPIKDPVEGDGQTMEIDVDTATTSAVLPDDCDVS